MVMPMGAPEYLRPQTVDDLSSIGVWTNVSITQAGSDALESARVLGIAGKVLEALNAQSPQRMEKLADSSSTRMEILKPAVIRLARQGFVRVGVRGTVEE